MLASAIISCMWDILGEQNSHINFESALDHVCLQFSVRTYAISASVYQYSHISNICTYSAFAVHYMAIKVNSTILILKALVGVQVLGTTGP